MVDGWDNVRTMPSAPATPEMYHRARGKEK